MPSLRLSAAALLLLWAGQAQAQNCLGRPDFDACMQGFTAMQQNRLAQSQQQLFQQYVATNQEWLQRNYAQHRAAGGQMTFAQFAYWGLMTANGTNMAGAAQAQRDWFQGTQNADRTIQQGHADYNAGSAANSRAMSDTARNYSEGAVRGNAAYIDPETGKTRWLPYGARPGQPFNSGGQTYVQAPNGTYYQQRGNGWVAMEPAPR